MQEFHFCPEEDKGLGIQHVDGETSRNLVQIPAPPPSSEILVMTGNLPEPHWLHMENGGDVSYKLEDWLK